MQAAVSAPLSVIGMIAAWGRGTGGTLSLGEGNGELLPWGKGCGAAGQWLTKDEKQRKVLSRLSRPVNHAKRFLL